jgi:hypothetical protein
VAALTLAEYGRLTPINWLARNWKRKRLINIVHQEKQVRSPVERDSFVKSFQENREMLETSVTFTMFRNERLLLDGDVAHRQHCADIYFSFGDWGTSGGLSHLGLFISELNFGGVCPVAFVVRPEQEKWTGQRVATAAEDLQPRGQ